MCGIVGYIGKNNCLPLLVEGLKRLEYRGYDSSGISCINQHSISTFKKTGKIVNMEATLPKSLSATIGIGHTRWATHGGVTDENSHPHLSQNNKFAIVHNGIIENYKTLKTHLENDGFTFRSSTDSEVIAHLLEKNYTGDFEKSFHKTLSLLEGTYGIVALSLDNPDYLMIGRKGSPLVLGIGNDEMFVASDVSAFLRHTKQVVYLEDNEISKLSINNFKTTDFTLEEKKKEIATIDWDISELNKNNFEHYLLKEIFEQPESIRRAFAGRFMESIGTAKLGGLNMTPQELINIDRVGVIACGTSYHAGLVGSYVLEELARVPTAVHIASEIRYKNPIVDKNSIYFAVSQSGETIDTFLAMKEFQRKGSRVLGICNVVGSTIPRESNGGVYVHSGPEISVASTKAFTSQLTVFYLFSLLMGRMKDVSQQKGIELIQALKMIPEQIEEILKSTEKIQSIAKEYSKLDNFLFLGRGISFPVALEGALKLKEISYRHAEGIPAGEIKHGPIALIDKNTPVIFIVPKDHLQEKMISNIEEVKARGGRLLAICTPNNKRVKELVHDYIEIPECDPLLSPLLSIIPLQLLAYYVAKELGCDIDQPRNLAKSVTVE